MGPGRFSREEIGSKIVVVDVCKALVCADHRVLTAMPGDNNIRVTFAIDLNNDLKVMGPVFCNYLRTLYKSSCVQQVWRQRGMQ